MFFITFYSYKGGVGRTMSLVNVAAELSQRGRKVLIVDFDLEAPGIPSFQPFATSESRPGIVDFVTQYINTSVAPVVSEFIVETVLATPEGAVPLWVFPAGKQDQYYGTKLSSIDWQDLYETRSGYLLFEDMKQQIRDDARQFDYVLIDSRTGHTDVGGICTRQLADAIAFMFFPNKQNISGLKTILGDIRSDRHVDSKPAKLIFCPSNVPDLDDEDGILKSMLDEASSELGYNLPAATIRHYNSMALVDQKIFVIDRPRTKLSAEYRKLTESLMELNIEDRDGAILYLQRLLTNLRAKSKRGPKGQPIRHLPLNEITANLEKINSQLGNDGEICWLLAAAYRELGDIANELESLTGAINGAHNTQKAYLNRAFILLRQSRIDEAKMDLLEVLSSTEASPTDLRSAIEAIKTLDPNWVSLVERSPLLNKLEPEEVSIISDALQSDERTVALASQLLERAYQKRETEHLRDSVLFSNLVLTCISSGQFTKAIKLINASRKHVFESSEIQDVFNYAIAEWGESGNPPYDLFGRVLELAKKSSSDHANFYQCLSLASAITDDKDNALIYLNKAKEAPIQGVVFSCWSYLTRQRPAMEADLHEMEIAFNSGLILPEVISRNQEI
jgi:MinD-like ATPase involved in chromosome partitioning or flagellar assembly